VWNCIPAFRKNFQTPFTVALAFTVTTLAAVLPDIAFILYGWGVIMKGEGLYTPLVGHMWETPWVVYPMLFSHSFVIACSASLLAYGLATPRIRPFVVSLALG
jgi:hypothetical protein